MPGRQSCPFLDATKHNGPRIGPCGSGHGGENWSTMPSPSHGMVAQRCAKNTAVVLEARLLAPKRQGRAAPAIHWRGHHPHGQGTGLAGPSASQQWPHRPIMLIMVVSPLGVTCVCLARSHKETQLPSGMKPSPPQPALLRGQFPIPTGHAEARYLGARSHGPAAPRWKAE